MDHHNGNMLPGPGVQIPEKEEDNFIHKKRALVQ